MSRELLKQALYALKYHSIQTRPIDLTNETIEALRQELAKPEQELVCDKDPSLCGFVQCQLGKTCKNTPINTMPTKIFAPNLEQILNAAGFYRREWDGLTDDEIRNGQAEGEARSFRSAVRWVEAKLKEKNNAHT